MVRNVGGTPRPFGDDKKKISINDASTNGSVIKKNSWLTTRKEFSPTARTEDGWSIDNVLIQNLTDIVEVFNENRYDVFKMKQELMMLRDDLNVWLEMNQADTQKQINEKK